jgi:hypothetical protein
VAVLVIDALSLLQSLVWFKSVYVTVLKPGRLVGWVEGAVKMERLEETCLLHLVAPLVYEVCPQSPGTMPAEAPGMVSLDEWREGSVQLRQEVRGCPPGPLGVPCVSAGPCAGCVHQQAMGPGAHAGVSHQSPNAGRTHVLTCILWWLDCI